MNYEKFLKNTEEFVFMEDSPHPADIIFVPGNGFPQMAERAAQLYREGYAPLILPSGKYSITEGHFAGVLSKAEVYDKNYLTEWEFLHDVLRTAEVPEHAILREDRATFTYENAIYSRRVTDQAGLIIKNAILCCKTWHARRAWMYYRLLFPETSFYVCPACPDGITRENWMQNEEGVRAVTGEITRIIQQFSLMLKKNSDGEFLPVFAAEKKVI